jgi:hypothetical protein
VGWLLFPAMFLSVFRTRLPNWIEGLARDFRNAYIAARENWSVPVELVEENLRAKQQEQSRSTPMLLQTKQPFRRENRTGRDSYEPHYPTTQLSAVSSKFP